MRKAVVIVACGMLLLGLSLRVADARPNYFNEFKAKYLKPDGSAEDKAYAEKINDKVKCLVCHGKDDNGKEQKKIRNAYGKALEKLIKKMEKDKEKINEGLDQAADEKSSDKKDAPTFGELIKDHKLPGGE